jgi:hypothetical protein
MLNEIKAEKDFLLSLGKREKWKKREVEKEDKCQHVF